MALFKILRGESSAFTTNLSEIKVNPPFVDGYCYFLPDTGMFYIDYDDGQNITSYVSIDIVKADFILPEGRTYYTFNFNTGMYEKYTGDYDLMKEYGGEDNLPTYYYYYPVSYSQHRIPLNANEAKVVQSIKEINKGLDQKFWRGTKEEYKALDVKNEDTMYIVIDEEGGSIKADWNQNDETAPDYIKNRPFYNKTQYTKKYEGNITFTDSRKVYDLDLWINAGSLYRIEFNGEIFEATGVELGFFHNKVGDVNNNPIEIECYEVIAEGSGKDCWINLSDNYELGTYSLIIYEGIADIVTIPEYFLPESVKTSPDWNQNTYGHPGYILNRPGGYYDRYGDVVKFNKEFLPSDLIQLKNEAYNSPVEFGSIKGMLYNNEKFIAFENQTWTTTRFISSVDGFNWINGAEIPIDVSHIVCGDNGRLVAIQLDGGIGAYSDDGITWTEMTMPDNSLGDIAYGNGAYVVLCDGIHVLHSQDGISWVKYGLPNNINCNTLAFCGDKFIAFPVNHKKFMFYSEDGIIWNQATLPCAVAMTHVAHGKGRSVVVDEINECILYSDDGISWTQVLTDQIPTDLKHIAYGADKFVASNGAGVFYYSVDGTAWAEAIIDTNNSFYADNIVYGANLFIAYDWNTIAMSNDGIYWTTGYDVLANIENTNVADRIRELIHVQSDWNQNDETAPDYVKNRTHWVESEAYWTSIDSTGTTFIGETVTVPGENSIGRFSGTYQLSSCNKYRVTADGVEYVVEAYYETNNGYYMLYPGSLSIWLSESEVCMHRTDSRSSANMSIKIESYIEAVYHPLDEKFLPDSVATKPSMTRITLFVSNWDNTTLTQSVSIPGISADETAQLIQCAPTGASMIVAANSGIYCSGQAADTLTFTCTSVPTEDIQFNVSWQDCVWIAPLISFIIVSNGVDENYQAEEGMTWEEWVNSSYNTIGASLHDDKTFVWNSDGSKYLYFTKRSVKYTDQIVSGRYRYVNPL